MGGRVTVWYKGKCVEPVLVRAGSHVYDVSVKNVLMEVDEEDWRRWPNREFFELVEPPDPEEVGAHGPPLDRAVTIDPADGISDEEAIWAERALARYRQERVAERFRRILAVESQDWRDYYEAARDDKSDSL